jgi:epoxyqueuosine reductase
MTLSNQIVIEVAHKLGFDLVGFAKAGELKKEIAHLEEWLGKKYQAGMDYMNRNIEKRKNVSNIFADAKSILSLGCNYFSDEEYSKSNGFGKISRYAWG